MARHATILAKAKAGRKALGAVPPGEPSIDDVIEALAALARIVKLHGPRYAPAMLKIEQYLNERLASDPVSDADRILKNYEGYLHAVRRINKDPQQLVLAPGRPE